jgi:tRNA-splicing ligase RtcB
MPGETSALSQRAISRGKDQVATLGGGNHFIEIQVVDRVDDQSAAQAFGLFKDQIVVMIHSGSRGLGHQVVSDYMPRAAEHAKRTKQFKGLGFFDADSPDGKDYIAAMHCAANLAFANRQMMAQLVRKNLQHHYGGIPVRLVYDISHNMAKRERHAAEMLWVHRKGATRAFSAERMKGTPFESTGQPVLIPGSMGTASYVLLGVPTAAESLFSVNHGAGRVMSRTAAAGKVRRRDGKVVKKGAITDERFKESMKDVFLICENIHSAKEEAPDVYKDIDIVIEIVAGAGLANIVARLVPLAVLKG